MKENEVSELTQDLLELRQHLDSRLSACLKKLQGVRKTVVEKGPFSGIATPPMEAPRKRVREEESESSMWCRGGYPCRTDLSVFVRLIKPECLMHHVEAERNVGKKRRPCYIYGNYPFYYAYRLKNPAAEDPRLKCLKPEWFSGKDCLDIGCHKGVLTLGIVVAFSPKSMTGVEIDASLCEAAEKAKAALISKHKHKHSDMSKSLQKTRFLNAGVLEITGGDNQFDTVTCLSVCKWIHFHHGDEGIRMLFLSIKRWLRDNGILIMEPQSRRSYMQASRKQDLSSVPYPLSKLEFDPDAFLPYLVNQLDFQLIETLSMDGASKGFDRPIHILQKTASKNPHAHTSNHQSSHLS